MTMLDLLNVSAGYVENGKLEEKLHDITLSIGDKNVVGITGPSGCGKTTLIKTILLQTAVASGTIKYNGNVVNADSFSDYRKDIAYVPQNSLDSLDFVWTVGDQVKKVMRQHGLSYDSGEIENTAEFVGLDLSVLKRRPFEISYGTRHKIILLMALSVAPHSRLIIMDEPTTSLDPVSSLNLLKTVKRMVSLRNISFLIAASNPDPVFFVSDRVYVMYGGWIVEDARPEELLRNPKHPYTEDLIRFRPGYSNRSASPKSMYTEVSLSGCPFYTYCSRKNAGCIASIPYRSGDAHGYRCLRPGGLNVAENR